MVRLCVRSRPRPRPDDPPQHPRPPPAAGERSAPDPAVLNVMLIPLNWLKDYVDLRLAPEELAHRLTMAGLEVEEIHEGEGEPVLDITITPNRGDCLSLVGVAREVAALTGAALRLPEEGVAASGPAEPQVTVEIEAPKLCP